MVKTDIHTISSRVVGKSGPYKQDVNKMSNYKFYVRTGDKAARKRLLINFAN